MYTRGIGKRINWEKSLVFFINICVDRQRKIAGILGYRVESMPATYLGLPIGIKLPDSFEKRIIDRFNKKLGGWKGTTLNQAGKFLLVNATL